MNRRNICSLIGALFLLCNVHPLFAAVYEFDPLYSSISFKVKHLSGYTIGLFNRFGGVLEVDDATGQPVLVDSTVDVRSVYTRNHERDRDLIERADLFEAARFPQARFTSKKIEGGKLIGDLTLKGKTKEVILDYTFKGLTKDQNGESQATLLAEGVINRKDFGITYNRKLDRGQYLLGDQVTIEIEVTGKGKQ